MKKFLPPSAFIAGPSRPCSRPAAAISPPARSTPLRRSRNTVRPRAAGWPSSVLCGAIPSTITRAAGMIRCPEPTPSKNYGGIKAYVRTTRLLHLCAVRVAHPPVLYLDGLLRRRSDPLHPDRQAGAASLPAQEQEEYAPHGPHEQQGAGDPEEIRQQQGEAAAGDRGPLCPRGRQPHVRVPVVLPALPHPDRPVLHHPYTSALLHVPV